MSSKSKKTRGVHYTRLSKEKIYVFKFCSYLDASSMYSLLKRLSAAINEKFPEM